MTIVINGTDDFINFEERAGAPSTPASGDWRLYTKSDGLYIVDDAGTEYGPFGTGSSVLQPLHIVEGRLTLTSGTPVTTGDVTAATTVYFTPLDKGNRIALYDGSSDWDVLSFAEKSVAVPATTVTPFDIFAYNNAGTVALEALSWTNDTTRATALTLQDGVYVKTGATTRRYLGTGRTTSVSGQTEDSATKRFLVNFYNPEPRLLFKADPTNTWTWDGIGWRYVHNDSTNRVEIVSPLGATLVSLEAYLVVAHSANGVCLTGIGEDSAVTIDPSTLVELFQWTTNTAGMFVGLASSLKKYASIGYHYYSWLERTNSATATFASLATGLRQSGITGVILG